MELESIYSMQKSKPRLAIELSAGIGWNGIEMKEMRHADQGSQAHGAICC